MNIRESYKILGLSKNATLDDVKSAFRKRAFELHPDLNPGNPNAQADFQKLNEAYVLLRAAMADEPAARPGKPTADRAEGAARYKAQAETEAPGRPGAAQGADAKPGAGTGAQPGAAAGAQKAKRKEAPTGGRFTFRKEEVLGNILNDPFARKVFEDIYSQIRKTGGRSAAPARVRSRSLSLRWGGRETSLDLTFGLWSGIKGWFRRQMDDEQTVRLPANQLLPGNRLRLQIRRALSGDPLTVEVPIPPDYVIGRALRLRGLGRKLGPFKGDLYLRLMAQ